MWQPYCNVCEKYIDGYTYIYICDNIIYLYTFINVYIMYICINVYIMLYIKYFILFHYKRVKVLWNPFRVTSVLGVYIYGSKGDYIFVGALYNLAERSLTTVVEDIVEVRKKVQTGILKTWCVATLGILE